MKPRGQRETVADRLQAYQDDVGFVGAVLGAACGPFLAAMVGAIVGLVTAGNVWPEAGIWAFYGLLLGPFVGAIVGDITQHRKAKHHRRRGN